MYVATYYWFCSFCVINYYRYIKKINPKMSSLLGAGALLLYLDVCIRVIPSTDPDDVEVLCNVSMIAGPLINFAVYSAALCVLKPCSLLAIQAS